MKLQTIKPKIGTPGARLSTQNTRPRTVEGKRCSAGVKDGNKMRKRNCGLYRKCREEAEARLGDLVNYQMLLWQGGSDDDDK